MRARALAALLGLLGAAGCAPGALAVDARGPDGTHARVHAVRSAFLRGEPARAVARLKEKDAGGGDALLQLLERGQVALHAGDATRAAQALEDAHWMIEGRVTRSLSNGAAALLTSDRALPYVPGTTERAMRHYYAARAWLQLEDVRAAAVEARRLSALLAAVEGTDAALPPALTATFHDVAAALYEAAGEWADADVAARLAARARGADGRDGGGGDSAAVSSAEPPADAACAASAADDDAPRCATLIVFAERGLVSQRSARGLGIALADGDLRGLATVRDDATGLASVLAAIDRSSRPVGCGWGRHGVCGWERRALAGPVTIINVSWPALSAPRRPAGPLQLAVGEHQQRLPRGVSLSEGVASDFGREAPGRLARALARTALRQGLVEAGEASFRQARKDRKHDDAWRVAGAVAWLAAGASTLAERADTRSWALLPDELSVHRVHVPAGEYVLRQDGPGGALLGTVQLRAGETRVVAWREWGLGGAALLAEAGSGR
jgi:hypothetical protein